MNHKFRVWDKRCKRFVHDVFLDEDTEPSDYYGGVSQNEYKIVVGNIFEELMND